MTDKPTTGPALRPTTAVPTAVSGITPRAARGTAHSAAEPAPFRPDPRPPGNLTAVPLADQTHSPQHAGTPSAPAGPGEQPGLPRPSQVRPKPLAALADQP